MHWQCEKQCQAALQMVNFEVSPTKGVEVHTDAAKYTKSTVSPALGGKKSEPTCDHLILM